MFNRNKNVFSLLKWLSTPTFAIASIGLSTLVFSSCSKTNSSDSDDLINVDSQTIRIDGINDNGICNVDSSLFPEYSSHKFGNLKSDIVLGVNELTNYDITELTITFSSRFVQPVVIKIKNGEQESDKKYNGIEFKPETNPQEFGNNKFSKVLRIKKEALKKVICDVKPLINNDINISFSFDKIELEKDAKSTRSIYINLFKNDPQEMKDNFIGVKLNNNDSSDTWYKTDEHNVNIDELSSIIIAYKDDVHALAYASDDQHFFIRKKFDNLSDNFDESLIFKTLKTNGNITTFELENKISPILGDIYVTNIHSEYRTPNIDDYYYILDNNKTIFLSDESIEIDDANTEISGFYFDDNNEKKDVQYKREDFNYIVNVGKNITTIGNNFLYGCKKIEYVNFVNGFDKIYSIGSCFLNNCESLKSIKINNDVSSKLNLDWHNSDENIQYCLVGMDFLKGCVSFNQEININNRVNISSGFLHNCTNFNSNIAIDTDYSGSINMWYFMTNCDNMVSTITLNAPRRAKDMQQLIFSIDDKTTLTTRNKNANSYINGIKIASNTSSDHITTFMKLVPNLNGETSSSIYYRKLIPVHNVQ